MVSGHDRPAAAPTFAIALVAILALLIPAPAAAGVHLSATCNGDSFDIAVDVFVYQRPYDPGWPPADWIGLVVERRMLGECAEPVIVTPEVLPFPALSPGGDGEIVHRFSDPVPWPNRWFSYRAKAIDAEGQLHDVPGQGDPLPYDHVACGEGILSRGYLEPVSWIEPIEVVLRPCPGTCWGSTWLCTTFDLPTMLSLLDTPVNLYGEPWDDGMPTSCPQADERIVPVPQGSCGPLPVRELTWGAVKGIYR